MAKRPGNIVYDVLNTATKTSLMCKVRDQSTVVEHITGVQFAEGHTEAKDIWKVTANS